MSEAALSEFSLIVPYYNQPQMLERQIGEWNSYPAAIRLIVVDDGSRTFAEPVIRAHAAPDLLKRLQLFRIYEDIPWNRGGARNLGVTVCATRWLVHVDIDHLLPWEITSGLLEARVDPNAWYRFNRSRLGRADDTRKKDKIDAAVTFGAIHPHIDSYAITRDLYWRAGGYDEDYSGCLGGGSPFLQKLEALARPRLFDDPIHLIVVTRSVVADSSVSTLDRGSEEYSRRRKRKEAQHNTTPQSKLRFKWARVL